MGYGDALTFAAERLAQIPPETVCQTCGARYEGGKFFLPWFNREISLSAASEPAGEPEHLYKLSDKDSPTHTQKILWLHYLIANGVKEQSGRLIAYREVAPALFYEPNFYKRAVRPLVGCFGKNSKKLVEIGVALGGKAAALGDASVTINVLPYLPMTFIIWEGCEEFPPDGNILFDQTAKTWFASEDLAVLASVAVYELIGVFKKENN